MVGNPHSWIILVSACFSNQWLAETSENQLLSCDSLWLFNPEVGGCPVPNDEEVAHLALPFGASYRRASALTRFQSESKAS